MPAATCCLLTCRCRRSTARSTGDAPVLTIAVTSLSLPVIRLHDLTENRLAPKLRRWMASVCQYRRWPAPAVRYQWQTLPHRPVARRCAPPSSPPTRLRAADGAQRAPRSTPTTSSRRPSTRTSSSPGKWQPAAPGMWRRLSTTPKPAAGRLVRPHTRRDPQRAAAARANVIQTVTASRLCCRDRRRARVGGCAGDRRPHHDDSCLGGRHRTRAAAGRGAVVMVIFLFLRSASATVIPSVAVPVSLVARSAIYLADFRSTT